MIGIRLADSTFFSICSDGPEKKRVVLSPANNNQKKVKIDLFRYNSADDGYYIGSLFLESICYNDAGESEIELFIDTDGKRIRAVATDLRGQEKAELEALLPGIVSESTKGIKRLQIMLLVFFLMMAAVTGILLYSMLAATF